MKYVKTKGYDGKYTIVPVSDEVYEALRQFHNEVQALHHREIYVRKNVKYSDQDFFRFHFPEDTPEEKYLQAEADARLYDAIFNHLTPTQRRRILMLLEENLSMRDVSKREHCSYNSVKESLKSALKKLRNYMSDEDESF